MGRDVAHLGVVLDNQLELANRVVARNGRVGPGSYAASIALISLDHEHTSRRHSKNVRLVGKVQRNLVDVLADDLVLRYG